MEKMIFDGSFYKNKKVFITGHTGFKGSWMCRVLSLFGAEIRGFALKPPTDPSLFEIANIAGQVDSVTDDIRDRKAIGNAMAAFKPEIVIHMAAQPIVRDSYKDPVYTYETNVMGTVNVLEAVRGCGSVRSFVNVTTDKVYMNKEWVWGYRETEELNGYDPYSNSKSCSELVTDSYKKSFFEGREIAISTARAGNVIGGGDFATDRIVPDCVRAAIAGRDIIVRNAYSTRPYQHVLEPVMAYLILAQMQYEDPLRYSGSYNIGPDDADCVTTGALASLFCEEWGGITWKDETQNGPHEANLLKLDCSKIKAQLGIFPRWHVREAVKRTVDWTKEYISGGDMNGCMKMQIDAYLNGDRT
jgi:CDP-glucose 4,6-dehydratase